jgi:hypothetical protein
MYHLRKNNKVEGKGKVKEGRESKNIKKGLKEDGKTIGKGREKRREQ